MKQTCNRRDCTEHAVCVIGIEFYPPKALMAFYKTDKALSRMVLSLLLCDTHFVELEADGVHALMSPTDLAPIIATLERNSKTAVDPTASKLVRVGLRDPDYLRLIAHRTPA